MKKFFKQCLKNLELINGSRQYFFMQCDLEDGERQMEFLIQGMVNIAASPEFDDLSEERKQAIITKMMIQDKYYDKLNLNLIHKWLTTGRTGKDVKARNEKESTSIPSYQDYVKQCEILKVKPLPIETYDKPIDIDRENQYMAMFGHIAQKIEERIIHKK